MHFHIVKMYKDKEVKKNVKNICLSMCDGVEISAESVKACSFHHRKSIPDTEIIYSMSFRYNRFANNFFPQLL